MKRIIPFLACCLFLNMALVGQTYYTSFDEKCLDRYEFITDTDRTPYVVYTSKVSSGKVVQLDVGKESTSWEKKLPGNLSECTMLSFNKAMALAINDKSATLYIVRESPTAYNISKVEKATLIESNGEKLNVIMSDADFTLNYNMLTTHSNLANAKSQKDVYLEGTVKYQCMTGYMFKKIDKDQAKSFKEYTIVPGFGIVNKRSMPHEGAITNSLRLDRVNNATFVEFATNMCKSIIEKESEPELTAKDPVSTPESFETAVATKTTEAPKASNPCGQQNSDGIHYVQKGETVYSISRRYGISVSDVQKWNSLTNSNVINICQKLVVKQSALLSPVTTSGNPSSTAVTGTPVATQANDSQFHIVKPGESVQQIAEMYGYTESRFRTMNSLGEFERVYAGQKLYTSDCNCPNNEGVASDSPLPYDSSTPVLTTNGNPDVYFRPIKVHLVRQNETLFAIARQYDTTVDRIRELNGLDQNAQLAKDQRIYVQ